MHRDSGGCGSPCPRVLYKARSLRRGPVHVATTHGVVAGMDVNKISTIGNGISPPTCGRTD